MQNEKNTGISADTIKSWVELYSDSLYSWAFYKTSKKESAEDIVQETFLAALQSFEKFEGKSNPKTWLFAILNHKIIDFYRKKINQPVKTEQQVYPIFFDENGMWKPEKRPQEWPEDESHLLDDTDFQAILHKCLDALPEKWNTCVKLKYLSEKSGDEICQELDIAPTNFWQIVHRAKLQLRECVERNCG